LSIFFIFPSFSNPKNGKDCSYNGKTKEWDSLRWLSSINELFGVTKDTGLPFWRRVAGKNIKFFKILATQMEGIVSVNYYNIRVLSIPLVNSIQ